MTSALANRLQRAVSAAAPVSTGRVSRVVGLNLEVEGVEAAIGDAVAVTTPGEPLMAEVVAIREKSLVCMPFGDLRGVRAGADVVATGKPLTVRVGASLLGRVLDGLGRPLDGGPSLEHLFDLEDVSVEGSAPHPLRRSP